MPLFLLILPLSLISLLPHNNTATHSSRRAVGKVVFKALVVAVVPKSSISNDKRYAVVVPTKLGVYSVCAVAFVCTS